MIRSPSLRPLASAVATALPALVLVAGCSPSAPPAVQVDGVSFTRDQVLGFSEDRRRLLGEITAFGLALADGTAEELPEPVFERRRLELLGRLLHVDRSLDSLGVSDAMLRSRYRTDPELQLTVRHLIILSERHEPEEARDSARAKAARALDRIRAGEAFPDVAAEVSEEPGAEGREGLLEPGREGAWVPEFWEAARRLDPGEISDVVETQYGFHVLRLEGRDTVPFEEARPGELLEAARLMDIAEAPDRPLVPLPEGLAVTREALAAVDESGAADSLSVATWPGGHLSLGELRDHLATLEREAWRRLRTAGPDGLEPVVRDVVALQVAADSARARGLTVPAARMAEIRRPWSQRLDRWAASLGFVPPPSPDGVGEAGLRAMAASGQGADIARRELHDRAPLLHRAYDIRVSGDGGGPGA